ncbi:beta-lactamase/transpeptidase-like protein [Gymnopilus junonius]|uniref:Beta-lactamase/transpeptidase-like protein n=1 Tax=Gymnopilus junonius TaxID=109634 RepID=A0A9P5TP57_GYMJU|nr:beta-lactamase/transpeptidase-like protein [Gymnopilus junonius]
MYVCKSQAIAEGKVPGASYAVTSLDQELYYGEAGLKSFENPSAGKINDKSLFWICSQTKLVVTLIEAGKVSYETPVAGIIPELANPVVLDDVTSPTSGFKPARNTILVKHLLNHSSGLHYPPHGKVTPDDLNPAYTSIAYEAGFPSVPLAFEPGTSWMYGYSCDIIVFVAERVTGKSIQEYCKEHIFGPLGLTRMTFHLTPGLKEDLVHLTYRRKDGKLEKWADQLVPHPNLVEVILGGIGLYSTLKDYLAYFGIFSRSKRGVATIEKFTGWNDVSFGVGLCLATADWPGRRKKGSGFWYGWAGTYYFIDPAAGIAVTYGTQVVPTCDVEVERLWEALERALYAGLDEGLRSINLEHMYK